MVGEASTAIASSIFGQGKDGLIVIDSARYVAT